MAKQREKTTQPSYINQTSAPGANKSKLVRRSEEGLRARKESDRLRVKTRINSFTRWRKLKEDNNLRTDGDVANYLLDLLPQELQAHCPSLPLQLNSANVCAVWHLWTVDLSENLQQETEFSSTATLTSDLSQSKTIVNDSCLMELFKKCQTCGQPITEKKVSHCGAQMKVRWRCLGGHRGTWMSSPHLWEAFPEIHLLATLSLFFSAGTFTHFKKWAKHLQLNFMGHKIFLEIQKAYLKPESKSMNRTKQEGIFAKGLHQRPEGTRLHFSGVGCCDSYGFSVKNLNMSNFNFDLFFAGARLMKLQVQQYNYVYTYVYTHFGVFFLYISFQPFLLFFHKQKSIV